MFERRRRELEVHCRIAAILETFIADFNESRAWTLVQEGELLHERHSWSVVESKPSTKPRPVNVLRKSVAGALAVRLDSTPYRLMRPLKSHWEANLKLEVKPGGDSEGPDRFRRPDLRGA
jgi:hypothetical protein